MSKVFVFDHNGETQAFIVEVLECEGHDVRSSSDATLALKSVTAWIEEDGKGPDIILAEYFAPEDNPQFRGGGWLAHELKRCGLTVHTPLVIMCQNGSQKSAAALSKAFQERFGAVAYLPKPFTLITVRDAINGILWAHTSSSS
ncbi:MAG: response regulator [Patescibacteria group bacterium]